MKKTYSKPEIMFEDFSLSTNIASCGTKIEGQSSGNCAYVVKNEFTTSYIFTSDIPDVCTTPEADGEYNGICYYTVADSAVLFNS